jgi:nitroreductase
MIHDILSERFTARSFADRAVEPAHIEQFIDLLKLSPSKQNVYPYTVTLFGYEHHQIKEKLCSLTNCGLAWPDLFNPQVLAPLLIVWSYRPDETALNVGYVENQGHTYKSQFLNSLIETGISSMAILTRAHELGYVSGFCRCFQPEQTKELLSIPQDIILMLGIGYPSSNSKIGRLRPTYFRRDKPNFDKIIQIR